MGLGLEWGIANLIGEGMKGFNDSYRAEKDRQRNQAEADDEKSRRNRQMEASDFDAGREWDPETQHYKKADGANPLDANEQKQYTMLTQLANSQGEMWQHETNRPYREALNRLIQKSMGGMFPAPPTANPNALLPREPDATVAAPAKKSAALLPRQAQIAQTEALGGVPPAGAPAQKPLAGASVNSPYAPLKKKVMGQHAPGYSQAEWGSYVPKAEREQQKQNREKLFQIEMKEAEQRAQKLPSGDVLKLSESAAFPEMLAGLQDDIAKNADIMGPIQGRLGANNPYNVRAQDFNSKMSAYAQRIGKYMEGGVLRAEDVPKYARMLPQISDLPEVAQKKLQNVSTMLAQKAEGDKGALKAAGYNVPGSNTEGFLSKKIAAPKAGEEQDGYIFLGGDPANQKSWKKK